MSKADVTIDFDHHSANYKENWEAMAEERLRDYPLAWTEAHGGHWILSRYEDVNAAAWDPSRYSSAHGDPAKPWAKGILIPELPYNLSLSESDPPVHTARRGVEAPYFTPKYLRDTLPTFEKHLNEAVAEIIGRGEADLATDFAMRVAAQNTMAVVGIDTSLWREYMLSGHKASLLPSTDPDYPLKEIQFVQDNLRQVLRDKAVNPQRDLTSALATARVDGEPLPLEIQVGMISAAIFGGFGTVMSITLSTVKWLEEHPELHAQMLEDDVMLERLINEILRVIPPTHHTSRTVACDFELHGQQLRQGERILLSYAAANRDPTVFENPSEIRLDRSNADKHLSFSAGHHRCLGAPLGRLETRMMVRAILRHIPDFRIDHDRLEMYPSFANSAGFVSMPVTFTPKSL